MGTKISELDQSLNALIRRVGLNKSVMLLQELLGDPDKSSIIISDERRQEIIANYLKIETRCANSEEDSISPFTQKHELFGQKIGPAFQSQSAKSLVSHKQVRRNAAYIRFPSRLPKAV
jgi:hypothetical protein